MSAINGPSRALKAGSPSGLRYVLAELRLPAARWQIIAEAQHYGAPSSWMAPLFTLPDREFRDLSDIVAELSPVSIRERSVGQRTHACQRSALRTVA